MNYAGKGVPNVLAFQNCRTFLLAAELVPEADDIVRDFEAQGGRITRFPPFGNDPLVNEPELLEERERQHSHQWQEYQEIFQLLVNGNSGPFSACIQQFIVITQSLRTDH